VKLTTQELPQVLFQDMTIIAQVARRVNVAMVIFSGVSWGKPCEGSEPSQGSFQKSWTDPLIYPGL
jgi:hypothetical protein